MTDLFQLTFTASMSQCFVEACSSCGLALPVDHSFSKAPLTAHSFISKANLNVHACNSDLSVQFTCLFWYFAEPSDESRTPRLPASPTTQDALLRKLEVGALLKEQYVPVLPALVLSPRPPRYAVPAGSAARTPSDAVTPLQLRQGTPRKSPVIPRLALPAAETVRDSAAEHAIVAKDSENRPVELASVHSPRASTQRPGRSHRKLVPSARKQAEQAALLHKSPHSGSSRIRVQLGDSRCESAGAVQGVGIITHATPSRPTPLRPKQLFFGQFN